MSQLFLTCDSRLVTRDSLCYSYAILAGGKHFAGKVEKIKVIYNQGWTPGCRGKLAGQAWYAALL
jgi:hypothetical protein